MKRDMDLVRALVEVIRESDIPITVSSTEPRPIEGYTSEQIGEHLTLLSEAGYIACYKHHDIMGGGFMWIDLRLTWAGQEFAELAQNDTTWRNAKDKVMQTTGGLAIDVLKAALEAMAKAAMGL